MKRSSIFSVFIAVFCFAIITNAQSTADVVTISETINPDDSRSLTISFAGLEYPNAQLLELVVPATTPYACTGLADFSTAREISPDRARIYFDTAAGVHKLTWNTPRETTEVCRMLAFDTDLDARDFVIWRKTLGVAHFGEIVQKDGTGTSSATIRVHYDTGYGNRIAIRGSAHPSTSISETW